jgi:hypothetical protein
MNMEERPDASSMLLRQLKKETSLLNKTQEEMRQLLWCLSQECRGIFKVIRNEERLIKIPNS